MIEYIEFDGKEYPVAWVVVDDFGWELIGTDSLQDALSPKGTLDNIEEVAREVDETIFFYVPDEMIDSPDLCKYVNYEINQKGDVR